MKILKLQSFQETLINVKLKQQKLKDFLVLELTFKELDQQQMQYLELKNKAKKQVKKQAKKGKKNGKKANAP